MRITCPHCAASYDVPDRMIGAGRAVRCKRCAGVWTAAPEAATPEPAGKPVPGPAAPVPAADAGLGTGLGTGLGAGFAAGPNASDRTPADAETADALPGDGPAASARLAPKAEPAARQASPLTWAAWALSLLVLGGGAFGAIAARETILRAWPATARAYALLGFPPATSAASVPEMARPGEHH